MPYKIRKNASGCTASKPFGVIKTTDGELMGCHATRSAARNQQSALYASEKKVLERLGKAADHMDETMLDELIRKQYEQGDWVVDELNAASEEQMPMTEATREPKEKEQEMEVAQVEVEQPAEDEDETKMVGYPSYRPFGGAETWDDLDEYLEAEAMDQAVRQSTWEFSQMVNNVLGDETLDLESKSDLIMDLANALPDRVQDVQGKDVITDTPEDENGTFTQKIRAFLKAKPMKTVDGKKHGAEDFADVPDPEKPSTWKLPIFDESHISAAITALQPGGFRGQRVEIGSSKSKVVRRIRSAINSRVSGDDAKKRLRDRLAKVKALEASTFHTFKDRDGSWRWFGWVTNKWRDRDRVAAPEHGGEILMEEAHKEFEAWIDQDPAKRMPELWAWHTKGTAHEHRADWLTYADGFLMASGPLTEDEAKAIERIKEYYDLGMSHGFYALDKDRKNAVITKYRTFEQSYLPVDAAANPWTDFVTIEKEQQQMGLSRKKREFLSRLAGDDFVAEVEMETEGKAEALTEAGVDFKEGEEAAVEAEATTEAAAEAEPAEAPAETQAEASPEQEAEETPPKSLELEEINEKDLVETLHLMGKAIKNISDRLDTFDEQLKELSKSDREKIKEAVELTPKASLKSQIGSVIGAEETEVDGRSSLAKSKPEEAESTPENSTGIGVLDRLMAANVRKPQDA